MGRMRAETVIATHGNTDFDAFAAMLAARRLYPEAVVCLSGSLNRNVREFYRLHADELGLVEATRLELDAIRRLIVVETTHARRLGELEGVALDPDVETIVFDHHGGEPPDWAGPEHTILSSDGALTTTLVGMLAERELAVTPLEATAFALGIHEDTGSLTYPTPTQRDAEALALVPAPRRAAGAARAVPAHAADARTSASCSAALLDALEPHEVAGRRGARRAPSSGRATSTAISNLAHKVVDLTDTNGARAARRDGRRASSASRAAAHPELDASRLAADARRRRASGRRPRRSSGVGSTRRRSALLAGLQSAVRELRDRRAEIMSSPPRTVAPDDTVPTRSGRLPALRPERDPRRRGRPSRRASSAARTSIAPCRTASRTRR